MDSKRKRTFLYDMVFDDNMFRSDINKIGWLVSFSIMYFAILALVLIRHFTAENVNTDVTKYTMSIFISIITAMWIAVCAFFIQKRTILIDENGFTFKRLKKTTNYSWADVKEVDVCKTKNGNYIAIEFKNGRTYGTEYIKEIDNLIKKYMPKI